MNTRDRLRHLDTREGCKNLREVLSACRDLFEMISLERNDTTEQEDDLLLEAINTRNQREFRILLDRMAEEGCFADEVALCSQAIDHYLSR